MNRRWPRGEKLGSRHTERRTVAVDPRKKRLNLRRRGPAGGSEEQNRDGYCSYEANGRHLFELTVIMQPPLHIRIGEFLG